MLSRTGRLIALALLVLTPALIAQVPSASDPPKYALPPADIVAVFDAEPLPQTLLSPNKQVVALTKARAYPTIAELAQPMLRLAGSRVNPKTNGPHRASGLPGTGIYSITLKKIADGIRSQRDDAAAGARVERQVLRRRRAARVPQITKTNGIELWIADGVTGSAKAVVTGNDRINATTGDPCDWLKDNATMVCELVPSNRGAAPIAPTVPSGPTVHENYGKAAPAPTL